MGPEAAYEALVRFASSRSEIAFRLAMHAAIPQGFRPDMLHLLKLNFIPKNSADPTYADAYRTAEADVLLSPICRHIGSQFFEFDAEVRRLLLDNLVINYAEDSKSRVQSVSNFLLTYAEKQQGSTLQKNQIWRDYLEIQRWVALGFLDPEAAAEQMAAVLNYLDKEEKFAVHARIGGVASALSIQLTRHQKLLNYAMGVQALEVGQIETAREYFQGFNEQKLTVGNITLQSPHELLSKWKVAISEPEVYTSDTDVEEIPIKKERTTDSQWNALKSIIKQLPPTMGYYGSALGAIVLASVKQFPPELGFMAGSIGSNVLSNLIDEIASGEDLTDDEIRQRAEDAIVQSDIANLLTKQDFLQGYAQLIQRLDAQKTISQDILDELRTGFSKVSTADQVQELKQLITQLTQQGPRFATNKIFISYGRADDEPFVHRLYQDLIAAGFDVWWDRESMPSRGLTFLQEIRDAIDTADNMLLILGPSAIQSDYVKAEWQYALSICKPVIPILRLGDWETIPEALNLYHVPDFRDAARYTETLNELYRLINNGPSPLGKLVNVPSLPPNFTSRLEQLNVLKNQLLTDASSPLVVTTNRIVVSQGMGGIGKTVLVSALVRDCAVRRAFSDGIFWLTVGQTPILPSLLASIGVALEDDPSNYTDLSSSRARLSDLLTNRKTLIVLDDLWETEHARNLVIDSPRVRYLITTRNAEVANSFSAQRVQLGVLSSEESISLLREWAGRDDPTIPAIAERLGNLPLALKLAGTMLRNGMSGNEYLRKLDNQSLQGDTNIETDLQNSIELSLNSFSQEERQLFATLSIFEEDIEIPENEVIKLWLELNDNLSEQDAYALIEKLIQASLLQRIEGTIPYLTVHDLLKSIISEELNPENRIRTNRFLTEIRSKQIRGESHILIVEDYKAWTDLLIKMLQGLKSSYELTITSVDNYNSALLAISQTKYDLILTDTSLVENDPSDNGGFQLIRELRRTLHGQKTPVIIISGYGTQSSMREAFRDLKVVDYIEKDTFDRDSFIQAVTNALDNIADAPKIPENNDVYVSCTIENRGIGLQIVQRLHTEGLTYYLHIGKTIEWGDRWNESIEESRSGLDIMRRAQCIIILISNTSLRSRIIDEQIDYALNNSLPIIPVLLERIELPIKLASYQYLDMTSGVGDQSLNQLVSAVNGIIHTDTAPESGKTGHVFINYSRKDYDLVRRLRDDLEQLGIKVWTDDNLTPGTPNWQKAIENALRNSSALLHLMSSDSRQSEWTQRELQYAQLHNIPIYPIMIRGDVKDSVPLSLMAVQWVDMREDYDRGLQRLVVILTGTDDPPPQVISSSQIRIFAAYSRVDQAFAREFVSRLKPNYEIWSDQRLVGGQNWWQEILEQIQQCNVLLYLISPESLESQYCQAELQEALRLQKPILPIMIRRTDISRNSTLSRIAYIDAASGWNEQVEMRLYDALQRIEEQIDAKQQRPTQPTPTREPTPTIDSNRIKTSIALFGPAASGKTTLLMAFAQSMKEVDRIASNGLMTHRLEANNESSFRFLQDSLFRGQFPLATHAMESVNLTFSREPLDSNDKRQTTSSFKHELSLIDNRGELYTEGIDGSISNLQQLRAVTDQAAYNSWQVLAGCNGILLLLDPTSVETDMNEEGRYRISRIEYAQMVQRLMWLSPVTEEGSKRRIAICITKVDLLNNISGITPEEVLERQFGTPMLVSIRSLQNHFGNDAIRVFTISSIGSIETSSGHTRPNIISMGSDSSIINPSSWKPYKVYEPFFWLFESIERDLLESQSPTGLSRIFRRDKRQDYIPYLPA